MFNVERHSMFHSKIYNVMSGRSLCNGATEVQTTITQNKYIKYVPVTSPIADRAQYVLFAQVSTAVLFSYLGIATREPLMHGHAGAYNSKILLSSHLPRK